MTPTYINPRDLAHRSDAVVWNGVAYLPGVMPRDGSATLTEQTRDVLAQIDALLALAGTSKDMLLTATIWMNNVKHDAAGFNAVWNEWLVSGRKPVRACIESSFQIPGLMEVMVTAAVPA
ncbi:RidA family protein [Roseomonas sp. HJA6]|uniref:RidA family protein n=1 Tax=Roseomonas alba TaxID=2846776 RepID=A0ABS7AAQ2_9PROT|nr:RidA family protein [Neoroseomonas alba]MBW6399263.1 RidA family protein [Neoroseomonas alba]